MRKLLCALGVCLAAGCSKQSATVAPKPKLHVLATIAPMYCFAKNVAGDLADVDMIMPAGVSPKGYAPTDEDVRKIMQADVIVENGFGFEDWMDRLEAKGLKQGAVRVIAARGTGPGIPGLPGDPNTPPAPAPDTSGSSDGAAPELSGPPDPHVWLDPMMAIHEVQNIRDALMKADPVNANDYLANENRYESALRDLDDEVGRLTVVITKRRLLCTDTTFTYFLSRYEFPVMKDADTAVAVLAPAGVDASAWKEKGMRVIVADPLESGPASTDFYETRTLANAKALAQGLMQ